MGRTGLVDHKAFRGAGGETEHFLAVRPPEGGTLREQLKAVEERYSSALKSLGLAAGTAVFRRVFLSDLLNQAGAVRAGALRADGRGGPVALSLVQQAPLPGAKLTLLAYHAAGPSRQVKRLLSPGHVLVERNGLGHLWSTGLVSGAAASPAAQTRAVFGRLTRALGERGGTLRDNCVRTWLYLRNIDLSYGGMTEARKKLFARHGLTEKTHYLASTGIEGACGGATDQVGMDAYSILGLRAGQISYLNDYSRLCRAGDYNVTFERGTRVAYADRAHSFVSGTASIDGKGGILYPGDVLRQLDRALGNVGALLGAGCAGLKDLMYLIVYLRDPADHARVGARLREALPGLPVALVQGAVCRPGWLVEVEGVAVSRNAAPSLPSF